MHLSYDLGSLILLRRSSLLLTVVLLLCGSTALQAQLLRVSQFDCERVRRLISSDELYSYLNALKSPLESVIVAAQSGVNFYPYESASSCSLTKTAAFLSDHCLKSPQPAKSDSALSELKS